MHTYTHHVINMRIIITESTIKVFVQATDNKIAIVFIFHQFLDSSLFEDTEALSIHDTGDDLLQELLVLTTVTRREILLLASLSTQDCLVTYTQ